MAFIFPLTWQNAWVMLFISRSRVMISICIFLTLPYDQPSSILFMPHSSWMFSASLSRTFSKWGGMTIWRDRHEKGEWVVNMFISRISPLLCSLLVYLARFNRRGDEGGLGQELRSAQEVSHSVHIPLVLFHWLHLHLLFRQQGFITRSVTRWRQELKVTVSAAHQKPHPNDIKYWSCVGLFYHSTHWKLRRKRVQI